MSGMHSWSCAKWMDPSPDTPCTCTPTRGGAMSLLVLVPTCLAIGVLVGFVVGLATAFDWWPQLKRRMQPEEGR